MQSDKLPQMPGGFGFSGYAHAFYSPSHMRDYALAARKAALGEVFVEAHRRFLSNYKQGDPYQQGCCHEMMFFELWLKDLMEQDA